MIENKKIFRENGVNTLKISTFLFPVALVALAAAFPVDVRKEVRKRQQGRCADCGTTPPLLEIHHRVPESLNGSNTIHNAIGLCGEKANDCHEKWDRLALQQGTIYPGIPINEAPSRLFKNGRGE